MIEAMLCGLSETVCVSAGFSAAAWSLQSSYAVPFNTPHANIPVCAEFSHPSLMIMNMIIYEIKFL
jgi:hypothetical protein